MMKRSESLLRKFGKVSEFWLEAARPEATETSAKDISEIFPKNFKLYRHQCEAIEAIKSGKNVVLCSGTSSGKTEAAVLPMFEKIQPHIPCQALLVYPTKALTADQQYRIEGYARPYGLSICTFDRDNDERFRAVERSEILLTNPQMLLYRLREPNSVLPRLFKNLAYVILDEIHLYSAFEVNLLFAMVRLIQECIKPDLQVIALSATVGNPEDICRRIKDLTGKQTVVVAGRANHPPTKILFLSSISDKFLGDYPPQNEIATRLAIEYARDNVSTLVFTETRRDANMIAVKAHKVVGDLIAMHHGALEKQERIAAETGFRNGDVKVMVTVKTLQQGIDIGSTQRIVHVGLPHTQTDFWQRQGRMGRRQNMRYCESIIIPSPRVAFDMFVVSDAQRLADYLNNRIERILLKTDSKLIRMFLGCMKIVYGKPLERDEIDFLKQHRLIEPRITMSHYLGSGSEEEYALTRSGLRFIKRLDFYSGQTIDVRDYNGERINTLKSSGLVELQPNSIVFNSDIRDPMHFVVTNLDIEKAEAIAVPIREHFDKGTCKKIEDWQLFSRPRVDFSLTNPDSTFGNIVLRPVEVLHLEYSPARTHRDFKLKVVDRFETTQGQEEILSNYVMSGLDDDFVKSLPDEVQEETLIEIMLGAAFNSIRNGMRQQFDIGYDEFHYLTSVTTDPRGRTRAEFIFYESSCSDVLEDLEWEQIRRSARKFLGFVRDQNQAGLLFLPGSKENFKIVNDFPSKKRSLFYKNADKMIDVLIATIEQKLKLVASVKEDVEGCRMAGEGHEYVSRTLSAVHDLKAKYPELGKISANLAILFVDSFIECGYRLQPVTVGAARSMRIEDRYLLFLSVPALQVLSRQATLALVMHEMLHLKFLHETTAFENEIEEEQAIHEAMRQSSGTWPELRAGISELRKYVSEIQTTKSFYRMNVLTTVTGKIIENLRWQESKQLLGVHLIRNSQGYRYHVVKNPSLIPEASKAIVVRSHPRRRR